MITSHLDREHNSVGTILRPSATDQHTGIRYGGSYFSGGWTGILSPDGDSVELSQTGDRVWVKCGSGEFGSPKTWGTAWARAEARSYIATPDAPAWLTPDVLRIMEQTRDAAMARI